jgi:hypothetical protein
MFDDGQTCYCKKQNNKKIKISEVKEDSVIKLNGCMEFEFDENKIVRLPCEYDPDVGVMKYD